MWNLLGCDLVPRPKCDGESEFRNRAKKESAVHKLEYVWLTPQLEKTYLLTFSSRDRAVALASIAVVPGAYWSAPGREA